jgi:AraC family transcriptional activator of pobA
MNANPTIQQHPLLDPTGKKTAFLIENWGEMNDFHYDYLKAHRHDFYEVMIFEQGFAQHEIDFVQYKAKSGSVHFVAPDNVHLLIRSKNAKGFSIQFIKSYFEQELIDQLPFDMNADELLFVHTELEKALLIKQQIESEFTNNKDCSSSLISTYAMAMMHLLIRNVPSIESIGLRRQKSKHIDEFKRMLKIHFKEHLAVADYAEKLNISTKHLIQESKRVTGQTPLKLIKAEIIAEGKRQLFYTEKSVKEICYHLGFENASNFSNYFKKQTGYSPSTYRQEKGE